MSSSLFRAKRRDWVDPQCAPCWNNRRGDRKPREHDGDSEICNGIERTQTVKEAANNPRGGDGAGNTHHQATKQRTRVAAE